MLIAGLAASLGVALLMVALSFSDDDLYVLESVATLMPQFCMTLIWPVFVALFAAAAFSSETTGGTLDFLVSRPVSRARVWAVKIGLAGASCSVLVLVTVILLSALHLDQGTGFFNALLGEYPMSPAIGFLLFASVVLVSSRMSQPLAGAAAGALLAFVTFFVAPMVVSSAGWWARTGWNFVTGANVSAWRNYLGSDFALHGSMTGAAYLLVSLWLFAREELREGIGRRFATVVVVVILLGAFLSATAPYAIAQWTLSPAWGRITGAEVSPDGGNIVFDGRSPSGEQAQVWRAETTGGEIERLSSRWRPSFAPGFSEDGVWVAYFSSAAGPRRLPEVDLWVARADGSERRRVVSDLLRLSRPYSLPSVRFSPDNERIAVMRDAELAVVTVADGAVARANVRELIGINSRPTLIGWRGDGSEVIVRALSARRYPYTNVFLGFDVATGDIRTIGRLDQVGWARALGMLRAGAAGGDDHVVLYWTRSIPERPDIRTIQLFNAATGAAHVVTEEACHQSAAMAEGNLYYFSCHPDEDGLMSSRLHRVDASTLTDVVVTELSGIARRFALEPNGGRLAVAVSGARNSDPRRWTQTVIIDPDGSVHETFNFSGRAPTGWTADGRVVLGATGWSVTTLVLVDPVSNVSTPLNFY